MKTEVKKWIFNRRDCLQRKDLFMKQTENTWQRKGRVLTDAVCSMRTWQNEDREMKECVKQIYFSENVVRKMKDYIQRKARGWKNM